MLRKIAAVSLAVSFVAMATSGILMYVVEKPSFTMQMHPVHKVFGILMILAALTHLSLNFRGLVNHLKTRSVAVYGSALVAVLVLLYGVAINKEIPPELAQQMDEAAAKVEGED
jgi:cytochrome b561